MHNSLLTEEEIRSAVEIYLKNENKNQASIQEILDSGAIPLLKGFTVSSGKVSDSIFGGKTDSFENPTLVDANDTPIRLMIRSDRISTHDFVRGTIPFKGMVLATNHHHMRKLVENYIGTSQHDIDALKPNSIVIASENIKTFAFENIIRAYNAETSTSTSLYQSYTIRGEREFCGHKLPDGIVPNGILPTPIDTPSTKSDDHDISVAAYHLFVNNICKHIDYRCIISNSLIAFGIVSKFLRERGIILADTKTEHGLNTKGSIVSQDELYTMDSSRFWLLKDYMEHLEKLEKGEIEKIEPKSYSKEFARGFADPKSKKPFNETQRLEIAIRYIMGIQNLTNERFDIDERGFEQKVIEDINIALKTLGAKSLILKR